MNAYNPLDSSNRLQTAGLQRRPAEAIAGEINDSRKDLVTNEQLDAALNRQTIRLGGFLAAVTAIATAILGLLISIK